MQLPRGRRRQIEQSSRSEGHLAYARLSDPILVKRAKDGDARALEALCERYAPRVEKLAGPAGTKISFGPLLVTDDGGGVSVGRPTVGGMTVEAEIVEQGLGKKIIIFKYKRRKSYRRKAGHRQPFTAVKITAIRAGA